MNKNIFLENWTHVSEENVEKWSFDFQNFIYISVA